MRVRTIEGQQLTSEEYELLKEVNKYVFQISAEQHICFGQLLSQVTVFLKGLNTQSSQIFLTTDKWHEILKTIETYRGELFQKEIEYKDDVLTAINSLRSELYKLHVHKYECGYKYRVTNSPPKGSFDSSYPSITLFLENMSKTNRKEDVVYTYIREMFHAYFYFYIKQSVQESHNLREIEDCMVGFSTLAFLEQIQKKNILFYPIYKHAKREIQSKRYMIGNNAAYGFGKYVFEHCIEIEKWIEAYTKKQYFNMDKVREFTGLFNQHYPIDERECKEKLEEVLSHKDIPSNQSEQSPVSTKRSDDMRTEIDGFVEPKVKFKFLEDFSDIALRILLIDDKIGCGSALQSEEKKVDECIKDGVVKDKEAEVDKEKKVEVFDCDPSRNCSHLECKLCTIKRLMDSGEMNDCKERVFDGIGTNKDYFYWKEQKIECYYCPTITGDFIDNENKHLDFEFEFYPDIDKDDLNVQIVGVRDVRTALLLMSKYKFDMIFCDYLLDEKKKDKDKNSNERDYINQLFEFLSHNYRREQEKLDKNAPDYNKKHARLEALEKLRHDVLDNRGPLGKFWVMPVTGFNQTFIQDLHRSQINLIDYRWNISNGADPITTPWQFLYHLNKFIELQLRSCVYTMEKLLTLLLYTCQDLEPIENPKDKSVDFDDFQSFMGSEYTTLIQLYGNKFPIKRDAVTKNDGKGNKDKSVFATYVWKNFYANQERKYVNEIELYRLMHRFYHRASVMYEDQRGKKLLNDAFSSLWFFLHSNYKVRKEIKENTTLEELYDNGKGLSKLKEFVEKCTADKKRDKDKE